MAGPILELDSVTFRYQIPDPRLLKPWNRRSGPGLHNLCFSLPKGSIVGLIGANGAGKSTLMHLLCGLYAPEGGVVKLDGTIIAEAGMKPHGQARIGFMPEQVTWEGQGTPRIALEWLAALRSSEDDVDSLFKLVGLSSRADEQLATLSQGMRQRLSLAAALLGSPELLILDEPLNGLDPVAQIAFHTLLKQLAARGHTILVSSHMLSELDKFVDRIILLHRGQILGQGSLDEVERKLGLRNSFQISGEGVYPNAVFATSGFEVTENISGQSDVWSVVIELDENTSTAQISTLVGELSSAGSPPFTVVKVENSLADILSAATGLSPDEVGLRVDEHVMIPLSTLGGEEE